MNKKYQEITGYWVYIIKTPNNMYYVGQSRQAVKNRWKISQYQRFNSLQPYIEQFGWDDLEKIILKDSLSMDEALYWEDKLICMYRNLGCCINKCRSGNCTYNKEYMREYRYNHNQIPEIKKRIADYRSNEKYKNWEKQYNKEYYNTPYWKEYNKKLQQKIEYKIYQRVRKYNMKHTQIETPLRLKENI